MQLPKLEKRERAVLSIGVLAVVAIIGYGVAQGPYEQYRQSKELLLTARQNMASVLEKTNAVMATRRDQEALEKLLAARGGVYDFWSTVNRAVQKAALTERATTTSLPTEMANASGVRLTLTGVSMEELVGLLVDIHGSDALSTLQRVSYLRPAMDGKGLDCDFVLVTPRLSSRRS